MITDLSNLINVYGNHQKIQKSSERLFENSSGTYKLVRNITLYLFDLLQVASVIPAPYMTPFKAAKAGFNILFEGGDIVSHGFKIYDSYQKEKLADRKIEKWNDAENLIQKIRTHDQDVLDQLRDKYELKLQQFADETQAISIEKSDRWLECLELIDNITQTQSEEDAVALAELLSKRKESKINAWSTARENQAFTKKKSLIKIASSIAVIAVEILTLAALVLGMTSGSLVLTAIVGVVCTKAINFVKTIWRGIKKQDHPAKIAANSVESIAIMLAESKLFGDSPLLQKSFIKGFFNTCFAVVNNFGHSNAIELNEISNEASAQQKEKLRKKRGELIQLKALSELDGLKTAEKRLKHYQSKIKEAKENLEGIDDAVDWKVRLEAKIKKWERLAAAYQHMIDTQDLESIKMNIDDHLLSVRRKISNWKLNEDLSANQSLNAKMQIALNAVEIARFALLGVALACTSFRIGINFRPYIFGAGLAANLLYLGYLFFTVKTSRENQEIHQLWDDNAIFDSLTLS